MIRLHVILSPEQRCVLELQVPPHLAQPRMCDLLAFSVVIHLVGTRQRGVFRPRQFFTMDARLRRQR